MMSGPSPSGAHAEVAATNGTARMLQKFSALIGLVRELSSTQTASEIYGPALSALATIVGVDRASILLLDHAKVARFVAWRGLSDAYRSAVEGHFPWAPDEPSPRPIFIEDVTADPSLIDLAPMLEREHIGAVAFIPLIYGERLVGKFMLYYDAPHSFHNEEIELASAVAYLVAFAIERARLYDAVRESGERKDAFLAMLGHELRNPLATVSAALANIESRPNDLPLLQRTREILGRGVGQMVKLVDDLLDVSRVTRGVIEIEKRPVDLTSLVHHAIEPIRPLMIANDQTLTLSLEPLWVEADVVRLEQIITNLIDNAAKYTPSHGHIQVITRGRDHGVEIRVVDDGVGIDPENLSNLFDLFTQVDRSLARSRGGLGIGLTIVRELVRLHGGTVSAHSMGLGKGSEFSVWLPRRVVMEARPPAVAHQKSGPRHKILVVDDNDDLATMLVALLHGWGHEVTAVSDGAAALAEIAAQRPEIVLLDIGLPGMSGYEVAERIRASGDHTVRIVALSGYGQPQDVARALAAGCDAHLTKPVRSDALERVVAETPSAHQG